MQAVILNSGTGKRMGRFTADRPKCLVKLNGVETILSRQVGLLLKKGVDRMIITTGPFADKIGEHLERRFPGRGFTFVHNPLYNTTNYIYSLLLCREHINEDVILMHGDLVFEESIVNKIIASRRENAVLVNSTAELPEKDFKGMISGGMVREISVHIFGPGCHFLIPMYRLSMKGITAWIEEMEAFKKAGNLNVYAEDALNNRLSELTLYPEYFDKELLMEIDNPDDLVLARKRLAVN